MKDIEVYKFLKRVQQKFKAKRIKDAMEFVRDNSFLVFCSQFGESPRDSSLRHKWMGVRNAFSNYRSSSRSKKLGLTEEGEIVDIRTYDEILAGFIKSLKVSTLQRFKIWLWVHFCRGW